MRKWTGRCFAFCCLCFRLHFFSFSRKLFSSCSAVYSDQHVEFNPFIKVLLQVIFKLLYSGRGAIFGINDEARPPKSLFQLETERRWVSPSVGEHVFALQVCYFWIKTMLVFAYGPHRRMPLASQYKQFIPKQGRWKGGWLSVVDPGWSVSTSGSGNQEPTPICH